VVIATCSWPAPVDIKPVHRHHALPLQAPAAEAVGGARWRGRRSSSAGGERNRHHHRKCASYNSSFLGAQPLGVDPGAAKRRHDEWEVGGQSRLVWRPVGGARHSVRQPRLGVADRGGKLLF
jgi:hypothetical protein